MSERETGRAWLRKVYGWDIGELQGPFLEDTVDHLFGKVWDRPGMTLKERRLLLLGLLIGMGEHDVAGLQLDAALRLGELDETELRDLVAFVAHYAGWPRGAKVNQQVEELLVKARSEKPT